MTREEYRSQTGIKTQDEARERLGRLRVFFLLAFVLSFVVRAFDGGFGERAAAVGYFAYFGFLGYFVFYCAQTIRLTKPFNRASAAFAVVFAPFSWFGFYPALTEPLRIIAGELDPPAEPVPALRQGRPAVPGDVPSVWTGSTVRIVAAASALVVGLSVIWAVAQAGR